MKTPISELGIIARPGMTFRRAKKSEPEIKVESPNLAVKAQTNMKIGIKGLKVDAYVGVYHFEKGACQPLIIDIEVLLENNMAIVNDEISETIDYDTIVNHANNLATKAHYQLIETFAQKLGEKIMMDARIAQITLRISKPNAIKAADCAFVEICLGR